MSQDFMNQEFSNSNNTPIRSGISADHPLTPEDTLRLLATAEPPVGLADRVHSRLARAKREPVRRSVWASLMPMRRLQYAGAAVLTMAVAGSMWQAYHPHVAAVPAKAILQGTSSGIQGTNSSAGAFKTAGTATRPPTLKPIQVPGNKSASSPKKKPSASRVKPAPKTTAQTTASGSPIAP